MDPCFTPGKIFTDQVLWNLAAEAVEAIVKTHYCKSKGGCHEYLKPGNVKQSDFFDVAMGFHRCKHLASYIKLHNPHVNATQLAKECNSKKEGLFKFPIPDMITHDPPGRLEFYEIKPDNARGKSDADEKINWFLTISDTHVFNLPYAAGTLFSPAIKELIWDGTWYGTPAKVRLHIRRDKPARLLYKFCIEANLSTLSEMLWKQLIKAAVAALIIIILKSKRKVPIPTPPPPQLPIPVPIPIPIPRVPVPAEFLPFENLLSPLAQSVGDDAVNAPEDVMYAQTMLGHWLTRRGFTPPTIDGICGNETVDAIHFAHEEIYGPVMPADRIVPNGHSILTLQKDHWKACVESSTLDFDAPLAGEFTTEEEDNGSWHIGIEPDVDFILQHYFSVTYWELSNP